MKFNFLSHFCLGLLLSASSLSAWAVKHNSVYNNTNHAVLVQWEATFCAKNGLGVCHVALLQPGEIESFDYTWGTFNFNVVAYALDETFEKTDIIYGSYFARDTSTSSPFGGSASWTYEYLPLSFVHDFQFDDFKNEYLSENKERKKLQACSIAPEDGKAYVISHFQMPITVQVDKTDLSQDGKTSVYTPHHPATISFLGGTYPSCLISQAT